MATMIQRGDDGEEPPMLECDECGTIFGVVFARNPIYSGIEYCPFCGDEIEGFTEPESE